MNDNTKATFINAKQQITITERTLSVDNNDTQSNRRRNPASNPS
jgi:hypothetical protein